MKAGTLLLLVLATSCGGSKPQAAPPEPPPGQPGPPAISAIELDAVLADDRRVPYSPDVCNDEHADLVGMEIAVTTHNAPDGARLELTWSGTTKVIEDKDGRNVCDDSHLDAIGKDSGKLGPVGTFRKGYALDAWRCQLAVHAVIVSGRVLAEKTETFVNGACTEQ